MSDIYFDCVVCGRDSEAHPKVGRRQNCCGRGGCQRKYKALQQQHRIKYDRDYAADQRRCNGVWREKNRGYWTEYRQKNPKKAQRNNELQKVRNRQKATRKPATSAGVESIAKMAELKARISLQKQVDTGQFWLIPVIAKMDALKVNIQVISVDSA
jgi:hypothetical protein